MNARRLAFAAPWVVVIVGCRRPIEVSRETEREPSDAPMIAIAAPYDAQVLDASMPDAAPDAAESDIPICRRPGVICNPPRPGLVRQEVAEPAPKLARVVRTAIVGDLTEIWISVGANDGVTAGWTGTLLRGDDDDAPLDHGELTILRVDRRVTIATVRVSPDVVHANVHVRLRPPPPRK